MLLLAFFAIAVWTRICVPARLLAVVDVPAWMVEQAEVPLRFFEQNRTYDVLLIGSSLLLAPVYRMLPSAEQGFELLKKGNLEFLSRPYENAVNSYHGTILSVRNLCVPGTCAQDQEALLRAIIDNNKPTRLVVYATSIRDFIDNSNKISYKSTLMYRSLNFSDQLKITKNKPVTEVVKSQVLFFRSAFKLLRIYLVDWFCKLSGHPAALWDSKNSQGRPTQAAVLKKNEKKEADLKLYRKRYLPLDLAAYKLQLESFKRMTALCDQNQVKMLVILMPVSDSNVEILPSAMVRQMEDDLEGACLKSRNVCFENFLHNPVFSFEDTDFYDSCHMSKSGFDKFMPIFGNSVRRITN